MSQEVIEFNYIDYKTTVTHLLQQRGSRLRMAVTQDSYHGKSGKSVNQIGVVAATKVVSRHADTALIDTPHDARWVYPTDYVIADMVDSEDKLRIIADPTGPYAQAQAMALGRSMDDEIIAAFFGSSKTGEDGGTSVTFASEGGGTIAVGGTGLTVAKLRDAKKSFLAAEVDIDTDPLFCAISAEQHDDLLSETQAINLDYTNRPVLVDGRITAFMGFNFIQSERLGVDSSAYRRVPCWAKSGMHLGIWNDIDVSVDRRPDKNNGIQVLAKATCGATRLEGQKIVEILCSEV